MEGALEGNHAVAVARATRMIAPGHFEGAFQRLDPELVKNTASAKVASVSPRRQPLAFGNAIEVGGAPAAPPARSAP